MLIYSQCNIFLENRILTLEHTCWRIGCIFSCVFLYTLWVIISKPPGVRPSHVSTVAPITTASRNNKASGEVSSGNVSMTRRLAFNSECSSGNHTCSKHQSYNTATQWKSLLMIRDDALKSAFVNSQLNYIFMTSTTISSQVLSLEMMKIPHLIYKKWPANKLTNKEK